jgi:hypothetical protein
VLGLTTLLVHCEPMSVSLCTNGARGHGLSVIPSLLSRETRAL